MTKTDWKAIAEQLKKPHGEYATQIGERMNESNRQMNLATISGIDLRKGNRVLEIGMGNGAFINDVFKKRSDIYYTGLDYSSEMIAQSSNNTDDKYSSQISLDCHPLEENNYEDERFHHIFTVNTIYFWPSLNDYMPELRRILSPEGSLTIAYRPKHLIENYPFTAHGFKMYDSAYLVKAFESKKWKVEYCEEIMEPDQEFEGTIFQRGFCILKVTR